MTEFNKRTEYLLGSLLWTSYLNFSKMVFMPLIYFFPFTILSSGRKKQESFLLYQAVKKPSAASYSILYPELCDGT